MFQALSEIGVQSGDHIVELDLEEGGTAAVLFKWRAGMSFREFVDANGGLDPEDAAEDWAAYFLDARLTPE